MTQTAVTPKAKHDDPGSLTGRMIIADEPVAGSGPEVAQALYLAEGLGARDDGMRCGT